MSVLIKGMEMPKSCDVCPFVCENDNVEVDDYRHLHCGFPQMGEFVSDYIATRHPNCPLAEIPKHGRLIDADALRREMYHKAFETDSDMQKWESGCWIRYKMFEQIEEAAPTVLEAED